MTTKRFVMFCLIIVSMTTLGAGMQNGPPGRQVVLISDLHFGVGRTATGAWHPFEDFRWQNDFAEFLRTVDIRGAGATDLVLVGDTFELWQAVDAPCTGGSSADVGCSEGQSLIRLRQVMAQHAAELRLLRDFAHAQDNRVFVIPGNHDAAILFPGLRREFAAAMGDDGRVAIAEKGYWISPNGSIYAEHGHQIGHDLNRFSNWPSIAATSNATRMERTSGERFVDEYYNGYEEKYPIVDNILDNGVGAYYVIRAEGSTRSVAGIGRFANFIMTKLSRAHYQALLGAPNGRPDWDFDAVRRQQDQFFEQADPVMASAIHDAASSGRLGVSMSTLADDEIQELCDARLAARTQRTNVVFGLPMPPLCPTRTRGAIGAELFTSESKVMQAYLRETARRLNPARPVEFAVFVSGHTHTALRPAPVMDSAERWQPKAVNTGAWQRTISVTGLKQLQCGRSESQVLTIAPESLPRCYSAVFIPSNRPSEAALLYWTQPDSSSPWQLSDRCSIPAC